VSEPSSYRDVIDEVRAVLTVPEIAAVAGVSDRAVQKWAAGSRPEAAHRDKLLDLRYAVAELSAVYQPEGVGIWLRSRQRALAGRRPLDVIREGRLDDVLPLIERLAGGPPDA
jgi:hypothetical protein